MRYITACLLFLLFFGRAFSQSNRERDSLERALLKTTIDTQKVAYLVALGDLYASSNPQMAIPYYEKAYRIPFKPLVKETILKAKISAEISQLYRLRGDSAKAGGWMDSSLKMSATVKDVDVLAKVYGNASNFYSNVEEYGNAISFSQKMIQIFDSAGVPGKSATAYLTLGNKYFKMEQDDKAVYYYKKAIAFTDSVKYPYNNREINQNVQAASNVCLAQVYLESDKYDSALYYCNKGFAIAVAQHDMDEQCTMLQLRSTVYQKLKRYAESVDPAKQALQIAKDDSITYQLYASYSVLAEAYAHTGLKDSALIYAKLCNDEATKNIVNKEDWVDVYDTWADVYQAIGDYKNALLYLGKEMDAYKSYRDNEVNKAINRAEIGFETKRKEQEITDLNELTKRQRTIQWMTGVGLVLAIAASVGFWLSYRNKNKAAAILEQSNKEKEVFLKEIHHRVKNNLQIISSLLYLQFKDYKDEKMIAALQQAQQRIKSMALVHNKLYEKQDVVHVYLKEYINDLAAGILASNNPEGKAINITVEENGNAAFSLDTSISIGLILNELITNSCKYAFVNKAEGNINIAIDKAESKYRLHIADNGVGLPGDFEKKNSLGVRLVKNLARQMGGEASFSSGNGTVVTILFTETAAA